MIPQEIEKYFEKAEDLTDILLKYQDAFERLDYYEISLREGLLDTPDSIDEAIKELVALYSMLNLVTKISIAWEQIKESKAYLHRKMEHDSIGSKYTDELLKKQSRVDISVYTRICCIFEAKKDSCDRMISVLQSCLKATDRERLYHKNA